MSATDCPLLPVHVVLAFNQPYAMLAAACLSSLSAHASPQRDYVVHILHDDLSKRTCRLLGQCLQQRCVSLDFMTCSAATLQTLATADLPRAKSWSHHALSKLFLPQLLPQLGRVIWLDADTICQTDIAELYDADLKGCALGAVRDRGPLFRDHHYMRKLTSSRPQIARMGSYYDIYTKVLGLGDQDLQRYFNSGVLLLDTQAAGPRLTDCAKLFAKPLPYFDQDVLNVLFRGQVKLLDACWNVMPFDIVGFEEQHGDPPAIIHNTAPKPWKCALDQPGAAEFWLALYNTPLWPAALEQHLIWRSEDLSEALPALQTVRLRNKDSNI